MGLFKGETLPYKVELDEGEFLGVQDALKFFYEYIQGLAQHEEDPEIAADHVAAAMHIQNIRKVFQRVRKQVKG